MNERTLCHIWNSLRFRGDDLRDLDGVPLQVVYRGRWQHGPGPDFRGAILIRPDGLLQRGDVEIHVRPAEWYAHRHHADAAFDGVILHVVLDSPRGARTLCRNGQAVPVLALSPYIPPGNTAEVAPDGWDDEPCRRQALLGGPAWTAALLDAMGDARFGERLATCEGDLAALVPAEVLYRGLLDAMGYSQNREPCRALAEQLPLAELAGVGRDMPPAARVKELATALLGMAGLGAWPGQTDLSGSPLARERWRLAGIRPANQPERRLRGLATIVATSEGRLVERLCLDWPQADRPRAVCIALRQRLLVPAPAGEAGPRHLIGPGRAADVVVNVLLPFAAAYGELCDRPRLAEAAWQAYHAHPRLSENEVTRVMAATLGIAGMRRLITGARRQQGLLHLFKKFCDWRRCAECPAAAWPHIDRFTPPG
ncbi:MAG: DUF2851 family protein [Chloroflexota bacterium]